MVSSIRSLLKWIKNPEMGGCWVEDLLYVNQPFDYLIHVGRKNNSYLITLFYGIDVGQGINVRHGKFEKRIKIGL